MTPRQAPAQNSRRALLAQFARSLLNVVYRAILGITVFTLIWIAFKAVNTFTVKQLLTHVTGLVLCPLIILFLCSLFGRRVEASLAVLLVFLLGCYAAFNLSLRRNNLARESAWADAPYSWIYVGPQFVAYIGEHRSERLGPVIKRFYLLAAHEPSPRAGDGKNPNPARATTRRTTTSDGPTQRD